MKFARDAAIAVALTMVSMTSGASAAESKPAPPLFEADYETPFGSIGLAGERTGGSGGVWFRIWKAGEYGSDVLSGHLQGYTADCWSAHVHFCITQGYMDFAAPPVGAPIGWTIRVGSNDIKLLSRQNIVFRGYEIPVLTLVGTNAALGKLEDYFVYNYDLGLIAFAHVRSDVPPTAERVPLLLKDTFVLGNESGLGGRVNCKRWKCGAASR